MYSRSRTRFLDALREDSFGTLLSHLQPVERRYSLAESPLTPRTIAWCGFLRLSNACWTSTHVMISRSVPIELVPPLDPSPTAAVKGV